MQEIKILAILSLVYISILSINTIAIAFFRNSLFTQKINIIKNNQSVLFYCFILSLIGTISSLYLSEVKGLEPCKFCWFERILLFPLVIIFLISWIKKEKFGVTMSLPFIILGMIMSAYHYLIQLFPSDESCDVISCSSPYIWELGFISIPLMAFFNFFGLLLIMINYKIIGEK